MLLLAAVLMFIGLLVWAIVATVKWRNAAAERDRFRSARYEMRIAFRDHINSWVYSFARAYGIVVRSEISDQGDWFADTTRFYGGPNGDALMAELTVNWPSIFMESVEIRARLFDPPGSQSFTGVSESLPKFQKIITALTTHLGDRKPAEVLPRRR